MRELDSIEASYISLPISLQLKEMVGVSCTLGIKERKLITSYAFALANAAVFYEYKIQISITTSTTELEFITAITLAKIAKYLRIILIELDLVQKEVTLICKDNITATCIANHNRLTLLIYYVDISCFVI